MGGGGQSQSETKQVMLPPWVEQAGQENYAFAKQIADRPLQQYGGRTVADLDSTVGAARKLLPTLDDYYSNYRKASGYLGDIAAYDPSLYDPSSVTATLLPQMDRAAYMNPVTNEVERRAIENASREGRSAQTQLAAAAAKGGGQGGSRQAIQQAVQGAETTRGIGDLSAKLRKEAYDTATQSMMADAERRLKAETQTGEWRQQALSEFEKNKLAANQTGVQAASQMAAVADQAQQARMNQIATYLGIGNIYQQQQQRVLDAARAKWEEKWRYPLEQLNIRLASLGMTPYGHTEYSTSKSSGGGGMGGLGQILGIGGQLLGMFSDREDKTDIEELGEHPTLPIAIYAYRYKKDPKHYPKVVGPMAQDVEKIAPHAVKKIGKHRVIDLMALGI